MGFRAYEQRPLAYHLATPVPASEMRRRGWVVMARCQACQLDLRIDLDLMVRLNGPDLILFGRTCRCRRLGCSGRMVFMGTPPGQQIGLFWRLQKPAETSAREALG
ncbi:hypothetical protein D3C77_208060 [compost metagenome]